MIIKGSTVIFILWSCVVVGQSSMIKDSIMISEHSRFFEKQGIEPNGYDYTSPEINLNLRNALEYRNKRDSKYIGAAVTGVLAATSFVLIQKGNGTEESFIPVTNIIFITFGSLLTIDFTICVFSARKSHRKMKENIILAKKSLNGNL